MGTSTKTGETSKGNTALEFRNVSFSYDGKPVLEDASLSLCEGEVVALVGNNGSGKSTIAKLASLFLLPSEGTVEVLRHPTSSATTVDEIMDIRKGIGLVMQNPDDQLVASIVVDEIAFGPSNLGLPREEVIERVEDALKAVGMLESLGANVNTLSGGQKQRIAIADALAMRPHLLILDEPTSMLDAQGQQDVRNIVMTLRDTGIAVLWITHSADEALLADRVLEIIDGRIAEACSEGTGTVLGQSSLGGNVHWTFPFAVESARGTCPLTASGPEEDFSNDSKGKYSKQGFNGLVQGGRSLIRFEDVSFAYSSKNELGIDIFALERDEKPVFEHLNLEVIEGETLAIVGPNGCGKSTMLQLMNGLLSPTAGTVSVCGAATASKEGANAARRYVGLCMQYPERSLFAQSVRDEIAFGPRNIGLSGDELEDRIHRAMEMMKLPYDEYAQRNPFSLSGGEQRKVALAGVIAMEPKVLALDEPCSSLDAPNHALLMKLLWTLKDSGQTIVLVTHDMRDVEALADRVFDMGCRRTIRSDRARL